MAGFYTMPSDQFHVYYCVGGPGDYTDVHQLFYNGMNWSDQDLTTLAKSAPSHRRSGRWLLNFSIWQLSNYQYVYYNDVHSRAHQLP
jgi:hypothetical protein